MRRNLLLLLISMGCTTFTMACDLCKSQQPEILRELAHGMGPQGLQDYAIVWGGVAIVGIVLIMTIYFIVFPSKGDLRYSIKHMNFSNTNNHG